MIRGSIFFISILALLISCAVNKKMHENTNGQPRTVTNPNDSDIYSAGTKMFISDYKKEVNTNQPVPGEDFIKKYSLIKVDGEYYVGVMIKVTDNFNNNNLTGINAIPGSRANDILSMKVPVQNVEKLSSIDGIKYVDVDHRVNFRKIR